MPEQAESFHVRCDRTGPVVEWLEKARALGLVLPQHGTLVTVCVPAHHVGSVIAASHFMMILYEYLDGERVTVRLYDGPREVTFLERTFEGKLGTTKFDPKPWITHRFLDRGRAKTLEKGLRAPWPDRSERHWVADVLGLHDVAWTTGEDLMTRRAALVERFPGSILVEAGDPVLDAERRPYRTIPPPAPALPTVIVEAPALESPPVVVEPEPAPEPEPPPPPRQPWTPPAAVPRVELRTPSRPIPAPAPTLAVLDELDEESSRERPAPVVIRTPATPAPVVPAPVVPAPVPVRTPITRLDTDAQPIERPALIADLPIIDEFDPDPAPPPARATVPVKAPQAKTRRPTGPVRAPSAPGRGLVLVALTKQRQAVLQDDPRLIEALLEARFEETIPGLLDLGARAGDLAALLAASGAVMVDALRAPSARAIPGTDFRIADRRAVVRVAALLRTIDIEAALAAAVGTYRLAEDLRDLIKLYTEAAQRGNAMLIAFD